MQKNNPGTPLAERFPVQLKEKIRQRHAASISGGRPDIGTRQSRASERRDRTLALRRLHAATHNRDVSIKREIGTLKRMTTAIKAENRQAAAAARREQLLQVSEWVVNHRVVYP